MAGRSVVNNILTLTKKHFLHVIFVSQKMRHRRMFYVFLNLLPRRGSLCRRPQKSDVRLSVRASVRACVRACVRQNRHFCEGDMRAWQAYTKAWIATKWTKSLFFHSLGTLFFYLAGVIVIQGAKKCWKTWFWIMLFFHLAKVIVIQVSQNRTHKEPLRGHPALRV